MENSTSITTNFIPQNDDKSVLTKMSFINKNPLNEGNAFSNFFFYWAYKIIALAKKVNIKSEYLGFLGKKHKSEYFLDNIMNVWEKQNYKNLKKWPLLRTFLKANSRPLIIVFVCTILISMLNIASIYFFNLFVKMFTNSDELTRHEYYIAFGYLSVKLFYFILQRKTTELLNNIGNISCVQLNNMVYNKLLKICPFIEVKTGQIYNYIQSDSHKLTKLMQSCPNLFSVPFLIIMYNVMLFKYMGISFLFGFVVMIIFLIVNFYYRKQFSKYLKEYTQKSDKRMRVSTECLNNLKVIKLNGWDDAFLKRIENARKEELNSLDKRYIITRYSQTLLWLAPIAMSVASIGAYQYWNATFKVEDMFTCLGIFTSIQNPMKSLPTTFDIVIETLISLGRIEKFLREPEIKEDNIIRNNIELIEKGIAIRIKDGFFSWGNNRDINKEIYVDDPQGVIKSQSMFRLVQKNNKEIPSAKLMQLKEMRSQYQPLSDNEDEQNYVTKKRADINMLNDSDNQKTITLLSKNETEKPDSNSSDNETSSIYSGTVFNFITEEVVLRDINLDIKTGEFICILGEVGSGKSSLIQAVLNNMKPMNCDSKIIVNGSTSYVGQEAWIQNNTVQSNIIFYKPMDLDKYEEIIKLCELRPDLDILPGGDMTEIGEKGVNLSGGQKARISLARAMYSDNDIFILDDPISALDAHVGKKIMINCIVGYLGKKTRVLVTHALQYASFADKVIYLKKGQIKWRGTYRELVKQDFYCDMIKKINSMKTNNQIKIDENSKIGKNETNTGSISRRFSTCSEIKRITVDEKKEIGTINKSVYLSYFSYIGGIPLGMSLFSSLFIWQILKIGSDVWLGYWSEHQQENSNTFFFSIYASAAVGSTLFNYWRTKIITDGSLKLSKRLHTEMIHSLIRAPINLFHDTVPKGQIFNRLSKDLPTVDTYSMYWLMTLTSFGGSFIGAVIVCVVYQTKCLLFIPFFIYFCWSLSRFYMNCSRELTRIEGMLNSPILNIVNETIPGSTTIRAFKYENKYVQNFQKRVDDHYKVLYFLNGTNQWYLLCMNLLSFSLLAFIVTITLIFKNSFSVESIGILLTYTIIVQDDMVEFLSAFSNFENTMTKMERSLSYTKIKPEKPAQMKSDYNYANWPSRGEIIVEDLSVRYRPDCEMSLNNISFHIYPGEHLGIVGRTGCGKSTLALCLFRILEPLSGRIIIDDVDISKVGLKKLRSSLTIIPQDSTIMDGSLRYNLDPLDSYRDEDIVKVMKFIGFHYILDQHEMGLNQNISENGSNLSIGEKQLICITRAILRKSKIVVMDEATASIDYKTEEIIQKALNTILFNSTLLSIAHRIKTVINSSKILVLDKGKLVEFEKPDILIKNKNSYFYNFYSKSLL